MAAQNYFSRLRTKLLSRGIVAEGTMAFHFHFLRVQLSKLDRRRILHCLIRPKKKPTQKEISEPSQSRVLRLKINSRLQPGCGTRHSNGR